jgi:hypothetical protein
MPHLLIHLKHLFCCITSQRSLAMRETQAGQRGYRCPCGYWEPMLRRPIGRPLPVPPACETLRARKAQAGEARP